MHRSAPGSSDTGLYSEPVRFPAYLLSQEGAVIRPTVVELDLSDLPAGDVLVKVEWSAINFKDAMVTRPGNRVARIFPLVPGVELAGIVEESTSPDFVEGQHVLAQGYDLGVARHGGFAAYAAGTGGLGRAIARRAELSQRRHHRAGRSHRAHVVAPPRPARHETR